jgi:hypothetical protein
MFEEVGEFSNFWTVVCEGCPFFRLFPAFGGLLFCFICIFRFGMKYSEKLLFCAMVFIAFHSFCCLSIVSGSDCVLLIRYR